MANKKTPTIAEIGVGIILFFIVIGSLNNLNKCRYTPKKKSTHINMPVVTSKPLASQKPSTGFQSLKAYTIRFEDNFSISLSLQDELGLAVVLAIDCSGSMADKLPNSQQVKYKAAAESLTEVVSFLHKLYKTKLLPEKLLLKIALLKFSSSAEELFPLTEMNETSFLKLQSVTSDPSRFEPEGYTAIGDTMLEAIGILMQSGTIFRSFIIITDGENTTGTDPQTVLKAMRENSNNKTTEETPVITSTILASYIGFAFDSYSFKKLQSIGSRFANAQNREELTGALQSIFITDIKELEAQ